MDKTELKQEIDVLIDSIKKQADRMNAQNNLSLVELDVLHHKIQKLYEKSILIHHLPGIDEKKAPITNEQLPPEEKPAPRIVNETPEQPPVKKIVPEEETEQNEVKQTVDLFGEPSANKGKQPILKPRLEKEKQSKTGRKPIPDLKAAISINDKFRFINELFEGNATEFNIALNQINNCQGSEDADIYLTNIRDIYQWKEDNESVSVFLDLVERRFL